MVPNPDFCPQETHTELSGGQVTTAFRCPQLFLLVAGLAVFVQPYRTLEDTMQGEAFCTQIMVPLGTSRDHDILSLEESSDQASVHTCSDCASPLLHSSMSLSISTVKNYPPPSSEPTSVFHWPFCVIRTNSLEMSHGAFRGVQGDVK